MGGSTMAGAGTVIIEEDLGAVERREGDGVHFALIRDGDLSSALTVDVYLSETGNMIGGKGTHSVTMPAEHDLGRLDVWTVDDDVPESASTISARVLPGTGYTVGSPSSSSVRVTDDDAGTQHDRYHGSTASDHRRRDGSLPNQPNWRHTERVAAASVDRVGRRRRCQCGRGCRQHPRRVTTRPCYQRHARRERSEWPPAGCSPGSPWTADSLRFGNRLRRTCGCGSILRLSA